MTLGPVQLLVLEFDLNKLNGEIIPEINRLRDKGLIRLVDALVVSKGEDGEIVSLETSDLSLDESMEYGAIAGALIGFGAEGEEGVEAGAVAGAAAMADGRAFDDRDVWYLADAIPPGSVAAIALIEHLWAIPLRDAIARAGGIAIADEWIHPQDLVAVGAEAALGS
jgi:uncharacterized membrane protein